MKALTPARVKIAFLAALLFWGPKVLFHAIATDFTARDIRVLTVVLPAIAFAGLWVASKTRATLSMDGPGLLSAVLGIWVLAPTFIMLGWTFGGGGFGRDGFTGTFAGFVVAIQTLLFPIFTLMMSGYDGSFVALGLVTLGLLLRAVAIWPRRLPQTGEAI